MLEDHLHAQLNLSRVLRGSHCPEIAVRESVADVFELRVVKRVERFRTEFKTAATRFAEYKALEESQVPVLTTRSVDRVTREVAKFSSGRG